MRLARHSLKRPILILAIAAGTAAGTNGELVAKAAGLIGSVSGIRTLPVSPLDEI
jgi:hypothetical protein